MKTLKIIMIAVALTLSFSLQLSAQDFGYPKDKAFYKAHWDEVLKDLGPDQYFFDTHYVLFDFDKDGTAELYLRFSKDEEYLYTIKDNKVIRVSETARQVEDEFWLGSFYPYFMAPYELLLDKPVKEFESMEQQVYDIFEIPRIWFEIHPKVEGTFNIKSALKNICCFDSGFFSDALYTLETGEYSNDYVEEFVLDLSNGYASVKFRTDYMNKVEACYWNMANGEKLLAVHYHLTDVWGDNNVDWFEHILFMKYNPTTKRLNPVVAPIEGFDFQTEYNFSLPRKGKNITLIGAENHELQWTGSGFKY